MIKEIFPNKTQCVYCIHKLTFFPGDNFFHTAHFYCNLTFNCIDGYYLKNGNCKFFEIKRMDSNDKK